MSRKIIFIQLMLSLCCRVYGQTIVSLPASGLMVDLVADGSYQSVNGYAIHPSVTNLLNPKVQSVLIGNKKPAFSWQLNTTGKSVMQTAYQILVADNEKTLSQNVGNIWNSGRVQSIQSAAVLFKGQMLKPNTAYYWAVRTWVNHQTKPGQYAKPTVFYTDAVLADHKVPSYPSQITDQKPTSFTKKNNVWFADFGKDAFSQLKLNLYSTTGNDSVIIRIGEVLDANGNINRRPSGNIRYAQYKIALQNGWHTYKLQLTPNTVNTRPAAAKAPAYIGEVTPLRYCEVEGYNQTLKADDLTRLFIHYKFDDDAAQFHSSDATLNAVWELCKYSIKATSYLGVYVDGDRERIPYEADAYINQLSHYAVDREYTIARKTSEYLIYHPTWPTEWIMQSVLIAWNDYLYTGDISSVKANYGNLKAKSLVALEDSTHLISTLNGKVSKDVLAAIHFDGTLKDIVDWPHGAETDGFVFTKYNAVVNAYYYRSLTVMQKIAEGLGYVADANYYKQKAKQVKAAYHKMFFDPKQQIYADGNITRHASLHTNMFALAFGLVDAEYQPPVLAFVQSRGMSCSVYGAQFLLDAIYNANGGDYGLSLLTSKTDRSWYNMIRVGSTITLEAWDNKYKSNQDWNHAWGAAAANIISCKLMGVEPLTPGWTTFSVKPQIGSLSFADIDVPTIKGTIKLACHQTEKAFQMNISIPANTSAQIHLPLKGKNCQIWQGGKKIRSHTAGQWLLLDNVGSGNYRFKVKYL